MVFAMAGTVVVIRALRQKDLFTFKVSANYIEGRDYLILYYGKRLLSVEESLCLLSGAFL